MDSIFVSSSLNTALWMLWVQLCSQHNFDGAKEMSEKSAQPESPNGAVRVISEGKSQGDNVMDCPSRSARFPLLSTVSLSYRTGNRIHSGETRTIKRTSLLVWPPPSTNTSAGFPSCAVTSPQLHRQLLAPAWFCRAGTVQWVVSMRRPRWATFSGVSGATEEQLNSSSWT